MDNNNIISSVGGGSGINSASLVDGLIAAERINTDNRLDARQEKLELQLSGYGLLASAMSTLQESAATLSNPETFQGKSVAFPETTVLTPTAVDADALSGEYEIEVLSLAKAHSLASSGFSDPDDAVGKGTLTFSFGSWDDGYTSFNLNGDVDAQTITIDDSNNSLKGLRDTINDADFGVQASIVEDGGNYKLLITAPSGANKEMEIVVGEEGASPTNNDPDGLSQFAFNSLGNQLTANQAGEDASLKVNGMEVSRQSNKIDDVIQGLEFTLSKPSDGELVAISILDDKASAQQSVRDFVDAYNEFYNTAQSLIRPSDNNDPESTDGGLAGDPTARSMLRQVQSMLSETVTGRESSSYNALSTVGIMTRLDGTLEIKESRFSTAFEDDFSEVAGLFMPTTSSTDSRINILKYKSYTEAGSFDVNVATQPQKGYMNGGAISIPEFDAATEAFNLLDPTPPSLDTSLGDYSFKISVDGTLSETITLTDTFTNTEEMRERLQSLINGDPNLKGVKAELDVSYDVDNDRFDFNSRSWGSGSVVDITEASADMANLGLGVANGTNGVDAVGTIDGESAFGSGNILLPSLDSDLAGMTLKVAEGASSATVTYSRGFATELSNIFDTFMADNGLIQLRENSLNSQLDDISEDRETLDIRMDKRRQLLESQFIAMERILASLNESGGMLDGLTDRLPFTASN
ncbi:MAG: flagellar filament capping protein FliD [Gammaproteobacteria bacterium]|nr:flagellar filament capping protein FliD [Gammaproteobacteria bacterium]